MFPVNILIITKGKEKDKTLKGQMPLHEYSVG
jgi:hypothetical protein